jgi:hypothetical protein
MSEWAVSTAGAQHRVAVMIKLIAAVSGAAVLAGALVLMTGMSSTVEAKKYAIKGDRLDVHTYGTACSNRGWPYFEASCLRDTNSPTRQARVIRNVSTDRISGVQ